VPGCIRNLLFLVVSLFSISVSLLFFSLSLIRVPLSSFRLIFFPLLPPLEKKQTKQRGEQKYEKYTNTKK
jgi:hypothetical protein